MSNDKKDVSKITDKERYKLKKLIKELDDIKGRHTELVSVYIPTGYNLVDVINQLKEEQGTAANIKSKGTRKNVMSALEKIIQHLRVFKKTPPNGLVVFSGNVSETEGKEEIELWSFEPPQPLNTKIYWCDQEFVLEPLKEMVEDKDVYGLIVLDARDANVGVLRGKSVQSLKHISSTVPSKTVKGGMSQHRYDKIREGAIKEFLNKIGDTANQLLLKRELNGIIIGGPGPIKEQFEKGKYLNHMLKKKVMGVKSTGYTGEFGLQELVERSEDLLMESAVAKEKGILKEFFTRLEKSGAVTYGINEVKKALEYGAVETLLISEEFDWVRVNFECTNCNYQEKIDMPKKRLKERRKCKECEGWMKADKDEMLDLMDVLIEKAEDTGSEVEIISTETGVGFQFKELGGVGAILRFKIS